MDSKMKRVLVAALFVADGRDGDVLTEDGELATTSVEKMIELETALCDAFETESDDVVVSEIMPKIDAL